VKKIIDSYNSSEYSSIKYDTYFNVYQHLLIPFIDKDVTIVEVGVFNGGSLFMWRDFLGSKARIIGIDLNPSAEYLNKFGFEIFIGDQSSPEFWQTFFASVGFVDLIIDDGGHSNLQQIVTLTSCLPYINNGGLFVCEDVHTSYFKEFGNPSPFSFVNYSKRLIDDINTRAFALKTKPNEFTSSIFSIEYFESIVAFKVNRQLSIKASPTNNNGKTIYAKDFRYTGKYRSNVQKLKTYLHTKNVPIFSAFAVRVLDLLLFFSSISEALYNLKYWKK
jgi:hypothetical protein